MSRILRRPMFRGGRVDSRGTGIASGLGYAGGGSVNTPKRGLVNAPGRYSQASDNLQKWKDELAIQKYKTTSTKYTEPYLQGLFENYLDKMYTGGIHDVDLAYGMQLAPPMSDKDIATMNLMDQEGGKDTAYELFVTGQLPGSSKNYRDLQKEQLPAAKLAGDIESFGINTEKESEELTQEQIIEQIRAEEAAKRQELIDLMNKQGTPEEEIEKNKAIFKKAYGSGVPEDASRMLLSAASRLLEPEATVKSGLGKFFGDESKVESKRSKYKDAATTAAINAYLTGQKDYDSMMKQMKMIEHGVDYKTDKALAVKKSWNLNDYVMNKGTGVSTSQALADGARDKIKLNPEYTGFKKIKSKENTDDLLTDEYVGIIFMDEGTREVFAVIEEDGTVGKRVLYQ